MSSPGPAGDGRSPATNVTASLDRAIELVTRAIDDDTKQNYTAAYKGYRDSLDYFLLALKYETNEKAKHLIKSKISEYLGRAEIIKEYLMKQQQKGTTSQPQYAKQKRVISSNLDLATEYAEQAVEEEEVSLKKAAEKYELCLDNFVIAIKYEKDENTKCLIQKTMDRHRNRLDIVKDLLEKSEHGNGRNSLTENKKDPAEELESHLSRVSLSNDRAEVVRSSDNEEGLRVSRTIGVEAGPSDNA